MLAALAALVLQAAPPTALEATPEATLAELERAYDQACNGRLYGQADDLCSDMSDRLRAYRADVRRRGRKTAGNATAPPAAVSATPPPAPLRRPPMPDQASTPNPAPPTDAAPDTPTSAGPGSTDSLAAAFEAARSAKPADDDTPGIAADDAGATSLAEEMGAGAQKP